VDNHVENFIYSSTAAVYGHTSQDRITEDSATNPTNPYGHSKLMSEQLIKDVARSSKLKYVILRYFNVAGASLDGTIGQRTKNATHLIKMAVQTACGLHPSLPIYGTNYPTFDGTCIRDFIHVSDLANAHLKAMGYLQEGGMSDTFNCGYGYGYSVKEVVNAVEKLTQKSLPILPSSPRKGDLAQVIADNTKIKQKLNWQPQYDDLTLIVKTALDWELKSSVLLSNA
jgi:UDP-glucose 4-epimerase